MRFLLAFFLYLPVMLLAQTTLDNWYGQWTGSFLGGDSGSCNLTFNFSTADNGRIGGTCSSNVFQESFSVSGQISASGSLTLTVGSTSNGGQFSGTISGTSGSGTWSNASSGLSGTWTISKVTTPYAPVAVTGQITDSSATISTRIVTFDPPIAGKQGAVFVVARVPSGSLVAVQNSTLSTNAIQIPSAPLPTNSTVLVQLTATGWQPVSNGQLIPYATGVLGDQLASQNILNNVSTTNLKGAQFCLGYGTSAQEMSSMGRMQLVATIPNPNATAVPTQGCQATLVPQGWSLLGNSMQQSLLMESLFNDSSLVNSVWKWDASLKRWQFYSAAMDANALQTYVNNNGYGLLKEIKPGEGYWVNAKAPVVLGTPSGGVLNVTASRLLSGWNLVATGNRVTSSAFNKSLGSTPATSLWTWDNEKSKWYFYAPSLESQGGSSLADYIRSNGYLDFNSLPTNPSGTLSPTTGFWVKLP